MSLYEIFIKQYLNFMDKYITCIITVNIELISIYLLIYNLFIHSFIQMLIILDPKIFDQRHVYFGDKQKNNIVEYCYFTSLYYSDDICSTNNLLFDFPIDVMFVEKQNNNYLKYSFDVHSEYNKKIIYQLSSIEHKLLNKYNLFDNKNIKYILSNHLRNGNLKVSAPYKDDKKEKNKNIVIEKTKYQLYIRISGVWENSKNEIGLIYKFIVSQK